MRFNDLSLAFLDRVKDCKMVDGVPLLVPNISLVPPPPSFTTTDLQRQFYEDVSSGVRNECGELNFQGTPNGLTAVDLARVYTEVVAEGREVDPTKPLKVQVAGICRPRDGENSFYWWLRIVRDAYPNEPQPLLDENEKRILVHDLGTPACKPCFELVLLQNVGAPSTWTKGHWKQVHEERTTYLLEIEG